MWNDAAFNFSSHVSYSYPTGDVYCQICGSIPCRCSYQFWTYPHCSYCGQSEHAMITQCPRVKEVLYFKDGTIRKILFHAPGEMK